LPYKYKDDTWFASFAPEESPELVVVVFVEHGGRGAIDAAPLARLLYESRFHEQLRNPSLDFPPQKRNRSILPPLMREP